MKLMQTLDAEPEKGMDLDLENGLRIPKREVPAEVTFLHAPGRPRSCVLFLSYYSPQRRGEESLAEYLDSRDSFLPLRDRDGGDFFISHVDQIVTVREGVAAETSGGRPLRLVLADGAELTLRACEPRLTWRARPIDLLNDSERFVLFIDENRARVHVNKRHIVRVEGL